VRYVGDFFDLWARIWQRAMENVWREQRAWRKKVESDAGRNKRLCGRRVCGREENGIRVRKER
jgi:hypothetical protein